MSPLRPPSASPAGANPSNTSAPCKSEADRNSPLVDWKPSGPRSEPRPLRGASGDAVCWQTQLVLDTAQEMLGFAPKCRSKLLALFLPCAPQLASVWDERVGQHPCLGCLQGGWCPLSPRSPLCAHSREGRGTQCAGLRLPMAGVGVLLGAAVGAVTSGQWPGSPGQGHPQGCSGARLPAWGWHVPALWGEHVEFLGRAPAVLAPVAHLWQPGERGFAAEPLRPPVLHPPPAPLGTPRTPGVRFGEHCMG